MLQRKDGLLMGLSLGMETVAKAVSVSSNAVYATTTPLATAKTSDSTQGLVTTSVSLTWQHLRKQLKYIRFFCHDKNK